METKLARGVSTDYQFPVIERDVFIKQEAGAGFSKVDGKKAIVRGDTAHVLAIVSDKYKVLPHEQVVDGFRAALGNANREEVIRVTKGGARLYYEVTLPDVRVSVKSGDELALKLIAINSYDGSHVLQVMFGAFRLVCSNGMIMGERFINLEQKHVGSIGMNTEVLAEQIGALTDRFKSTLPAMKQMAATKLDEDTKVLRGELFSDEQVNLPEYILEAAHAQYAKEGDGSVWGYYNAFTYVLSHSMRRESPAAQIAYGRIAWNRAIELIEA